MCGGTFPPTSLLFCSPGLSPRVRGNLIGDHPQCLTLGSIPACAGEPIRGSPSTADSGVYPRVCGGTVSQENIGQRAGVYPRVCGGTDIAWRIARPYEGLSPRVRGNLYLATGDNLYTGSIPACAGEPDPGRMPPRPLGVYPRVCGGTLTDWVRVADICGLSPRVRGNLAVLGCPFWCFGSIPACAGEPVPDDTPENITRVYPRVCGGTSSARVT